MLPVGFLVALTLWTGNEGYLYLTVAFIQVWSPARLHGRWLLACLQACNRRVLSAEYHSLGDAMLLSQMLKAFTPVIMLAALLVVRLENPTAKLMLSVLLMAQHHAARGEPMALG